MPISEDFILENSEVPRDFLCVVLAPCSNGSMLTILQIGMPGSVVSLVVVLVRLRCKVLNLGKDICCCCCFVESPSFWFCLFSIPCVSSDILIGGMLVLTAMLHCKSPIIGMKYISAVQSKFMLVSESVCKPGASILNLDVDLA